MKKEGPVGRGQGRLGFSEEGSSVAWKLAWAVAGAIFFVVVAYGLGWH